MESGLGNQLQIEPKAPFVDIELFKGDPLLERKAIPPPDDPEARQSRPNREYLLRFFLQVMSNFIFRERTGADQAHIPFEYIDELGKLVQRAFSKPFAKGGDARIGLEFVIGLPFLHQNGIACEKGLQFDVRVEIHGSEFETAKFFPLFPDAGMCVKNRSRRRHFDGSGAKEEDRRAENHDEKAEKNVEEPFDHKQSRLAKKRNICNLADLPFFPQLSPISIFVD